MKKKNVTEIKKIKVQINYLLEILNKWSRRIDLENIMMNSNKSTKSTTLRQGRSKRTSVDNSKQ